MNKAIAMLLLAALAAAGLLLLWKFSPRLHGAAPLLGLAWLIVVSKAAAIAMALQRSREGG